MFLISTLVFMSSLVGVAESLRRQRLVVQAATEDGETVTFAVTDILPLATWSVLTLASLASLVLIEAAG
jgi:hypothetical protein